MAEVEGLSEVRECIVGTALQSSESEMNVVETLRGLPPQSQVAPSLVDVEVHSREVPTQGQEPSGVGIDQAWELVRSPK